MTPELFMHAGSAAPAPPDNMSSLPPAHESERHEASFAPGPSTQNDPAQQRELAPATPASPAEEAALWYARSLERLPDNMLGEVYNKHCDPETKQSLRHACHDTYTSPAINSQLQITTSFHHCCFHPPTTPAAFLSVYQSREQAMRSVKGRIHWYSEAL